MLFLLLKPILVIIAIAWFGQTIWTLLPIIGMAVPTTSYPTCADLRKDFPTGLAATQEAADLINPRPQRAPRVHPDGYVLNLALDRDHNGVACTP